MWLPWHAKSGAEKKRDKLDKELASLRLEREIEAKENLLAIAKEDRAYQGGDSSVRARVEARREAAYAEKIEQRRRSMASRLSEGFDPAGLHFLTSAVAVERPHSVSTIKARIGESYLEEFASVPFNFDFLSGMFSKLYQVQGLIRELFPYKPTILRYIQALDFARWACRVLYEECPAAKGLVKGKSNFVIRRGLKCKVVRRDGSPEADGPAKEAQYFVDAFREKNDFACLEAERFKRRMIDGEAFLWVCDPDDPEEPCEAAFIEPDFIRPSFKGSQSQEDPHMQPGAGGEDWSFGILTPNHRYYSPQAYQVVWNTTEEEKIDAKYICHSAERERSNIKRCLPPLLSASDDLIRLTMLRKVLAESSKIRAGIWGVMEYEEASEGAIRESDDIYGRSLSIGEPQAPGRIEFEYTGARSEER